MNVNKWWVRVIGALISNAAIIIGLSEKMDWTAFADRFTGVGGPLIVFGLIGVVWTAALSNPKKKETP